MSGYVNTFKIKDVNKDNKLMSFHTDDCTIWTEIEDSTKILNQMLYLFMMIDI